MRYNIFLTAILIFCLSVLPCSAEFKGNIVQTGVVNGIQTGDDAKLNSLGVNYDTSGEAGTITLDKIEAGDLTEPIVLSLPSSSTSTKVLEIQDESGVTLVEVNADGSVKTAELQPLDDSSANVMRLPSGSSSGDILELIDADSDPRLTFSSSGLLETFGSSSGISVPNAFSAVFSPSSVAADLKLQLRDNSYAMKVQDSSGNDRFGISYLINSPTDKDTFLTWYGAVEDARMWFNESNLTLNTDRQIRATSLYSAASIASNAGYYGNTASDPAAFPEGIEVTGNITNDGLDIYYIGYDGTTINRFNYGYFANLNVSNAVNSAIFRPAGGGVDVRIQARTDTGNGVVLFQDYDTSNDRMKATTTVNVYPTDVDVNLSFLGGTNTGTLTWDDSAEETLLDFGTGSRVGFGEVYTSPTDIDATVTFYGGGTTGELTLNDGDNRFTFNLPVASNTARFNFITDNSETGPTSATYGITYPEQTAPSTPSSGGTMYFDSTAQELRFKDDAGNVYSIDLTPVP